MKRKTDLLAASDLRFSISLTSSRDYRSTRNLSDSWNGERYNVKKKSIARYVPTVSLRNDNISSFPFFCIT